MNSTTVSSSSFTAFPVSARPFIAFKRFGLKALDVLIILSLLLSNIASGVSPASARQLEAPEVGATEPGPTGLKDQVNTVSKAKKAVTQPISSKSASTRAADQQQVLAIESASIPNLTLNQINTCALSGELHVLTGEECILPAGTYTFSQITVEAGAKITVESNTVSGTGTTILAGTVTIEASGKITGDGEGYDSSAIAPGPGQTCELNCSAGGGGHGGNGGRGSSPDVPGGGYYGDALAPTRLGSGGGRKGDDIGKEPFGGGAIQLVVTDTLTVNGTLSVNGLSAQTTNFGGAGGGAGGSIWIDTKTIQGSGVISANGGGGVDDGYYGFGGGGGGGRIRIDYETNTFLGEVQAYGGVGGQPGGAGTIYWGPENRLTINNNGHNGEFAGLESNEYDFNSIELKGYGHLEVGGEASSLVLEQETIQGDGTSTLQPYGVLTTPSVYTITQFTLNSTGSFGPTNLTLGEKGELILYAKSSVPGDAYSFNSITINSLGTLTLVPFENGNTDYTDDYPFQLSAGSLTIYSGGWINSDGKGYAGEQGPQAGQSAIKTNAGGGGGGHGGRGGNSEHILGGGSYGDLYHPITLGSGGGARARAAGGAGGGAIKVDVSQTLVLNGIISANGLTGSDDGGGSGGGAGGSIWIQANEIIGNGYLYAAGGNGWHNPSYPDGGGGGGGRIAIYTNQTNPNFSTDGHLVVTGGSSVDAGAGEPGSVYLQDIDPEGSGLAVSSNTIPTDGFSTGTITITVKSASGPIAGKEVKLALVTGDVAYINGQLVQTNQGVVVGSTDSNGVVSAVVSAELAGSRTFQAQVGDVWIVQQGVIEFVPGPVDAGRSSLSLQPTEAPADNSTPVNVSFTARDRYRNLIRGLAVSLSASGTIAQPTLVTQSSVTDEQGLIVGQLTHSAAETVTVTAAADELVWTGTANFHGADLVLDHTTLAISKEGLSNTHVLAGSSITYTLTVQNSGLMDAANVIVTDTLPAGVTFSAQQSDYPFELAESGGRWSIGTLGVGQQATILLTGQVDADLAIRS